MLIDRIRLSMILIVKLISNFCDLLKTQVLWCELLNNFSCVTSVQGRPSLCGEFYVVSQNDCQR